MKKILFLVLASFLFVGCSTKEYVYLKPKPFQFQTIQIPKTREIRVYKADTALYKAYIENFRNIIKFQNKQIKDYEGTFNESNSTK